MKLSLWSQLSTYIYVCLIVVWWPSTLNPNLQDLGIMTIFLFVYYYFVYHYALALVSLQYKFVNTTEWIIHSYLTMDESPWDFFLLLFLQGYPLKLSVQYATALLLAITSILEAGPLL